MAATTCSKLSLPPPPALLRTTEQPRAQERRAFGGSIENEMEVRRAFPSWLVIRVDSRPAWPWCRLTSCEGWWRSYSKSLSPSRWASSRCTKPKPDSSDACL